MHEQTMFLSADQLMTRYVGQITADQWNKTAPATPDWTVRQLVAHVADDNRWVADMLGGRRVDDVKDQYADDPLGADPADGWNEAAESAEAAVSALTDPGKTVHLSYADVTARQYLRDMVIDRVIHAWDLANAIGDEAKLPSELVQAAYDWLAPTADDWRSAGILGPVVAVPETSDLQVKLLALSGRQPA